MKQIVKRNHVEENYRIDSAATSMEEIGNPMYPPMQRVFRAHGMPVGNHHARQLTRKDAAEFDLLIGFDDENMYYLRRICGDRYAEKLHRLTEYSGQPGEIEDPWYTRDFEKAYADIYSGCKALFAKVEKSAPVND